MAAKLTHKSVEIVAAGAMLSAALVSPPVRADVAAVQDSDALIEITVTARRRSESIHDTPVAVTALDTAMLESKNSVKIGDLQGAVPNVIITNEGAGAAAANLAIRGLAFADVEKSFDPTVGVVVDGVFLGTNTGQYLDFFDIAGFEVLRGPQGTLFGRNTIGGVINITRSKPTGEFGAKVELSYGSFDTSTERVVLNAPLAKDVLAAKVFYFNTKTDGFYRDAITGRNTGGSQNQNVGAAFLLTPGGGFDALLTVEKQTSYFLPIGGTLSTSTDLFGQVLLGAGLTNEVNRNSTTDLYTVFSNPKAPAPSGHYDAPAATLQMNLDSGPVKFTSVTSYRSSQEDQVQPFDGTSLGLYITRRIQSFHQFSQEFRAAGKVTDALDYVTGVYFYNGAYILTQYTDLFGAGFGLPQVVSGDSKSYAAFADFDWAFADQWRLNFGGRYTKDKKELNNTATINGVETFLGAPSATFRKFTPKASVDYRPNANFMYYASYSVGYRSGGFSNRATDVITTNTGFQPETVDSSEAGVKSEWFDRRVSLNADYFFAKYKNMQQNTTIPGGATGNETVVSNVGGSTIKGVELELVGRATQNLTLNASLGTLSSHFKGFVVKQVLPGQLVASTTDYSNNDLIFNPAFTAAASADYKIPMSFGDLRANVGYRHIASYDQQISLGPTLQPGGPGTLAVVEGNDPRVRLPHQNLVDASLTGNFVLNRAKAHVTLYGRNLTDTRLGLPFTVAGLFAFGFAQEPRSFGITLGFEY
ncbi:MAG: TonB-dependent receptor [Pseudomonadota bacterium]|nr:TonB-dependent receptor [Pseudomonadota bacterium]